mgnify:CR=1 FL=1
MSITIRRARRDDAAALPAIERSAGEAFRSLPALSWIADDGVMPADEHRRVIDEGTCWVAEGDHDGPIGFLSAQVCGRDLHIREIAVRHDRQGKGCGHSLIAQAVAYARAQSLATVTLTTFRNVPWNAPFYARLGFAMLAHGDLDARLSAILEREAAHGFAPETRCAMRLPLAA